MTHVKMGGGMGQGCLQLHRQVAMAVLHMHQGFSHPNEVADDCNIIS